MNTQIRKVICTNIKKKPTKLFYLILILRRSEREKIFYSLKYYIDQIKFRYRHGTVGFGISRLNENFKFDNQIFSTVLYILKKISKTFVQWFKVQKHKHKTYDNFCRLYTHVRSSKSNRIPGSSQTNDATSGPPQCKLCHLKFAVGSVTTQTGSVERGTSSLKYPLLARGW